MHRDELHLQYRAKNAWRRARKLVTLVRAPLYRTALRQGIAAAVEHERVAFRSPFQTILDVGASRGQFSVLARHRFPDATIVCFEPLRAPHAALARLWRRDPRVKLYNVALGAQSGKQEIHVSGRDDSSSLLPISARQAKEFPGTAEVSRASINVVRLDSVLQPGEIRRPSLLKIDVQGYELEVLRGAGAVLASVDEILVECSFAELYHGQPLADELICYLFEHVFRLVGVYSAVYGQDGHCLQADLLFARAG